MTKEDIIRMGNEADVYASCDWNPVGKHPRLWQQCRDEHFAALVAAAECEACAKVCEDKGYYSAVVCAEAIRARSQS